MKTLDADVIMEKTTPKARQTAPEMQPYGHIVRMPIALSETACKESVENLNQMLADTITLRDLYKKHHWQIAGPSFYQLHLLFDKHAGEQDELVDLIAERVQLLGTTWPRRRSFRGRRAGARNRPSRSRGCSMRTRSSSRKRARWPAVPPTRGTMGPTTCW